MLNHVWICFVSTKFHDFFLEKKITFSQMDSIVNLNDSHLHVAALAIVLAPTIWNILARIEYYTHLLTKIALNNPYYGCYLLTAWIFYFSLYRDYLFAFAFHFFLSFFFQNFLCRFTQAIEHQPKLAVLDNSIVLVVGYILMAAGSVFVVTSMYQLGVTGTYLGDYFGILMDNMVTSFPFNVMNNPMYDGSSLVFLGQSLTFVFMIFRSYR